MEKQDEHHNRTTKHKEPQQDDGRRGSFSLLASWDSPGSSKKRKLQCEKMPQPRRGLLVTMIEGHCLSPLKMTLAEASCIGRTFYMAYPNSLNQPINALGDDHILLQPQSLYVFITESLANLVLTN